MLERENPQRTRRHEYRYLFTAKHHGGDKNAAQWLSELSPNDEFAVFEGADEMDLSDEAGNLFGALSDGQESLRFLGTLQEQIAKFPCAPQGSPWHGYPVWPLTDEKYRPSRQVFDKMVERGMITQTMRRRLMKGDHV